MPNPIHNQAKPTVAEREALLSEAMKELVYWRRQTTLRTHHRAKAEAARLACSWQVTVRARVDLLAAARAKA